MTDKAAQGPSKRAKAWRIGHLNWHIASRSINPHEGAHCEETAFDAGYAAAAGRECVWTEDGTQCGQKFLVVNPGARVRPFCGFCGGKIKVKEGA